MLHDGTAFAGVVTASSPSQITLVAPNGEKRTYAMSQVDTVQYLPQQTAAADAVPANAPASPAPTAPPQSPAASIPVPTPIPTTQSAPATEASPAAVNAPPPPAENVRIVPAGAHLSVRNNDTIDSKTASAGQSFSGVSVRSVFDSERQVVIPRGSPATLVVRAVAEQGRVKGQSQLALDLDSVVIGARRYRVETADIVEKGRPGVGANSRTAKFAGGGAVLGTLLGAVAGGGRGAAIGAVSGAAAGTATQAVTRGKGVRVPAETLLTFRLEEPIRIRAIP
jgi:hypothetical protein